MEKLWHHDETGRLVWAETPPSERWAEVEICCEDELPADMEDETYSAWYDLSRVVEGVRVGPMLFHVAADKYMAEVRKHE